MKKITFTPPSLLVTSSCILLMLVTILLAYWQHQRAHYKDNLQKIADEQINKLEVNLNLTNNFDENTLQWRQVKVSGSYAEELEFYIDNKFHQKQIGVHVITPLLLDNGNWLLVNRGWIPVNLERKIDNSLPPPPKDKISIQGILVPDAKDAFELNEDLGENNIWQNLKIASWEQRSNNKAYPLVLLLKNPPKGLIEVAKRPDYRADVSRGYRLQWILLSLVILIGWIFMGITKDNEKK